MKFSFRVLFIYFRGLFEIKIGPGSCWHARLPVPGLMLARAEPAVSRDGWKGICRSLLRLQVLLLPRQWMCQWWFGSARHTPVTAELPSLTA